MPISFRPIVSDEGKVPLGEVNSTKKEEAVVREVLKKDFQGASVVSERSEDVFAKPVPKIISQVLAALKATKQDTLTAPEMAKDRGIDFYQRGVAQTLKDHSEVFLEAGWTYMPATRGRSATPHRWFRT